MWTDADIADALEEYQRVVRYASLRAQVTRLPNGTVRYFDFESDLSWWETDVVVVDGSWDTVTPSSFDWIKGKVVFAEHQPKALYISGKAYDFYAAAENMIDQTIAKIKARAIDRSDRDSSLKRSQQIATLQEMKKSCQAKQTPGFAHAIRTDTN